MCDSFTFFTFLLISEFHMGFRGGIKLLCGDQCCIHSGKACLEGDIGHLKRVVISAGVHVFTRAEHVVEANGTEVCYCFVNFRCLVALGHLAEKWNWYRLDPVGWWVLFLI